MPLRRFRAALFDLDGVITDTASTHAAAWRALFDEFLQAHAKRESIAFRPFDVVDDYRRYVDGKSRLDGIRSFLASRGIELPTGHLDGPADIATVHGLGSRKNKLYRQLLVREGVKTDTSAQKLARRLKASGLRLAVVSASRNCRFVLQVTGLTTLFDACVDGIVAAEQNLRGKPAPDTYIEAANRLGVDPSQAAVFEDSMAGVKASRDGGFLWVVGVNRSGDPERFHVSGADTVVASCDDIVLI